MPWRKDVPGHLHDRNARDLTICCTCHTREKPSARHTHTHTWIHNLALTLAQYTDRDVLILRDAIDTVYELDKNIVTS